MLKPTVKKFLFENLMDFVKEDNLTISDEIVFMCSSAGICMELLDLLESEDAKSYISHRGGSIALNNHIYGFRDYVDFLNGDISFEELTRLRIW